MKQIFALCIAWLIGINNHNYGIVIHKLLRLRTVYEHRRIIIRIVHKSCHQRTDGHSWIIHHDIDGLSDGLSCTVNTDGSTQGIHVCDLMSHDYDTVFGTHKLFERLSLHSRFYTGRLLYLLCLTAIVSNVVAIFNYHLVTAAPKCHLYGNTGIFIILNISGSIQTDTDT